MAESSMMELEGIRERLVMALVREYLSVHYDFRSEGVLDKDVVLRAGIASRAQVQGAEWTLLYRNEIRPALTRLYIDGFLVIPRLGSTGIWLSRLKPTKAAMRYFWLRWRPGSRIHAGRVESAG